MPACGGGMLMEMKTAGMPSASVAVSEAVAGEEGEVQPQQARREDEQVGVDALGHEELAQAGGVAEDEGGLARAPDERGEGIAHEHDAGHAARRGGARFHGHGDVGGAQGVHVVGAVADHGDEAPLLAQGLDDAALLAGGDAPEDAVRLDGLGERLGGELVEVGAGDGAAGRLDAELLEEGGDGPGVVAADDLGLDAELGHEAEGFLDLRAEHVADGDEGERAHVLEGGVGVGQGGDLGEGDAAQAAGAGGLVGGEEAVRLPDLDERLGRAQHERAAFGAGLELHRAPAPRRAERHLRLGHGGVLPPGEAVGEGGGGLALVGGGVGEGAQPALQPGGAGRPRHVLDGEAVGGERARLVEADDVGVVERLDGLDVLHDGARAGDAHGPDGEGDGHAQEQADGHDRGHGGGCRLEGLGEAAVLDAVGDEEGDGEHDGRADEDAQEALQVDLEGGHAAHDLARVRREPEGRRPRARRARRCSRGRPRRRRSRRAVRRRGPCGWSRTRP